MAMTFQNILIALLVSYESKVQRNSNIWWCAAVLHDTYSKNDKQTS